MNSRSHIPAGTATGGCQVNPPSFERDSRIPVSGRMTAKKAVPFASKYTVGSQLKSWKIVLSGVVVCARLQVRPASLEAYTNEMREPSEMTIEAAIRFFESCGLMARKVSANGFFGLSREI